MGLIHVTIIYQHIPVETEPDEIQTSTSMSYLYNVWYSTHSIHS